MTDDGSRITPTAHYTSAVWVHNGLSDPALTTTFGSLLHAALAPMNAAQRWWSDRPDLDMMLLARHLVLDHLLEREIGSGRVGQVLEIAAGLSGRGHRFARRFPGLRYLETDLPAMAAHKRHLLEAAGLRGANHDVATLDAFSESGPSSLAAVAARLDPARGTAIVSEGLLTYVDRATLDGLWRRVATVLRGFPAGAYLADVNLSADVAGMHTATAFRLLLSVFARGAIRLHFATPDDAAAACRAAGFRTATLHVARDFPEVDVPGRERPPTVRVLHATV